MRKTIREMKFLFPLRNTIIAPHLELEKNMRAVIKNIFVFFYGYPSFTFPYWFVLVKWRILQQNGRVREQKNKKWENPGYFNAFE